MKNAIILVLALTAFCVPAFADSPVTANLPVDEELAEAAAKYGISFDAEEMREELDALSNAISSNNGTTSIIELQSLLSANARDRFTCPKTYANLDITAWADASYDVSQKRFTQVHDKGFYYTEDSILFNFNVEGNTSAYVEGDGSLLVLFSGTIHTYNFAGQWLGSTSANFSCKFIITHKVQ